VHAITNHPLQNRGLPNVRFERKNRGEVIFQG
jgi:hypothetical protein